jgi:quinol monooxygenase YgiN
MTTRQILIGAALASWLLCGAADAAQTVHLAEIQIDPAKLDSYKAALTEEIETSVRLEPGVLGLYAMSEKDNPAHITILEVYADEEAYNAHLQSAQFKKYKATAQDMVTSLKLVDTVPIIFGANTKR